jgi:hypothetical protein
MYYCCKKIHRTGIRTVVKRLSLNLSFVSSEVIGGYLSGSLAIMSDAAHMFSGKKIIKPFSNKLVRFDTCIMERHVFLHFH